MFKVLVVDDDRDLRNTVGSALSEGSHEVDYASDGEEAVNRVRAGKYDLVLLDMNMPRMNGSEALKEIKAHDPSIIVILLTAFANVRDAVETTREGAWNYLEKPIRAENLVALVDRALRARNLVRNVALSAPQVRLPGGSEFVGQSTGMQRIFSIITKLCRVDTAVLIRGESGTGKELVAQALHHNSTRKDQRFVTVNCSAVPENLIESEFFGHEKGAFTGADTRKIGMFQYADGGTLFLDEIGDISPAMQVKLLRALQEKRFTPVGSTREIEVNVRIVAATNRNLEQMIRDGQFREDLFYRLNVLPIVLPPLRERKNDLEPLTEHFVSKFNSRHGRTVQGFTPEALTALRAHSWPGNIRELENVVEHAFVIEAGDLITWDSLPASLRNGASTNLNSAPVTLQALGTPSSADDTRVSVSVPLDFQSSKEAFEREFLIQALKKFKGRINQTALQANIPKKTLLRKLEKYGINARDYSGG